MLTTILQERLRKDRSLIPAMVRHEVADNLQPFFMRLIKQLLIVLPCTKMRIDLFEIQRVIPVIVGRLEDGRKHDGRKAQFLDVVKFTDDALQVSPAEYILTLWRHLPTTVESVNQQMIDSDVIKPVLHI